MDSSDLQVLSQTLENLLDDFLAVALAHLRHSARALKMNMESMIKSGCSHNMFACCLQASGKACICTPSSDVLLLCSESSCALVNPQLKCKSNTRCLCMSTRFALPCDNDVPCMVRYTHQMSIFTSILASRLRLI